MTATAGQLAVAHLNHVMANALPPAQIGKLDVFAGPERIFVQYFCQIRLLEFFPVLQIEMWRSRTPNEQQSSRHKQ